MRRLLASCAALLLAVSELAAHSPILSTVVPRGARRGSKVTLRAYGRNLGGTLGLLLTRPGIRVLSVKDVRDNVAQVVVQVAKDCPLGQHELRLRTKAGLSNVRTFWVGAMPELQEKEKNNTRDEAQKIALNHTVNGRITAEDVDWFRLDLKEPGRVNFEVQGVRLGDREFDPFLTVFDARGKVLAAVDNTALGRMDPICSLQLAAGSYLVQLREAAYGGNGGCFYRLHVGRFPRPVAVLPAGGRPGEELEVTLLGDGAPRKQKVRLPKSGRVHTLFEQNSHGTSPTPLVMSVVDLRNVFEAGRKGAQPVAFEFPAALNGTLGKDNEYDRWRVKLRKGRRVRVRALGRSLRSPIDPVLSVRQIGGRFRQSSDDVNGHPDARVEFRVPADGEYEVLVYDHLRRGSPLHVYRIEISDPGSEITTNVLPAGRYEDIAVSVPRGGRMATRISTRGAAPGTRLSFAGLPQGITAITGPVERGSSTVPVVFEAKPDAPAAAVRAEVLGARPGKKPARTQFLQAAALVRVRNQQLYLWALEERLPVAVTQPAPFTIEVEAPKVPLVQGSPMRLRVRVKRRKGFKSPVRVRMLYNPPGVGAAQVTIAKDEGFVQLNANGNAAVRTWKVALVGRVYKNRGMLETSTRMFDLPVVAPWMTAAIGKARAEQGQKTRLTVSLKRVQGFQGSVRAELLNLPTGAKTVFPVVNQGTQKIDFDIALAKNARPGRHRNLLLRLRMPSSTGEVVHHFRGGELRIDKPLPARRKGKASAKGKARPKTGRAGTLAKPKT